MAIIINVFAILSAILFYFKKDPGLTLPAVLTALGNIMDLYT